MINETNTMLEARKLSKRFGGVQAVDDVGFEIKAGETLGVVGPNGAGKTTLFNLLTNEIPPDSGSVTLDGQTLTGKPTHERVQAGLVRTFQVPRPFFGLSVRDNIRISMMQDRISSMLFDDWDQDREMELSRSVGLKDSQLEQLPGELAMGDLRKLELARALANNPKVLLLDEVVAGLTYGEIDQISSLLVHSKASFGLTSMIVSHDLKSLGPLVDRVMVIHFGQVLDEGAFDDVMQNEAVQSAYLGTGASTEAGLPC